MGFWGVFWCLGFLFIFYFISFYFCFVFCFLPRSLLPWDWLSLKTETQPRPLELLEPQKHIKWFSMVACLELWYHYPLTDRWVWNQILPGSRKENRTRSLRVQAWQDTKPYWSSAEVWFRVWVYSVIWQELNRALCPPRLFCYLQD